MFLPKVTVLCAPESSEAVSRVGRAEALLLYSHGLLWPHASF